ncbi:MAG: iron chaperone [Atopobiaceae bacterium]
MAEKAKIESVDAYIEGLPEEVRKPFSELCSAIKSCLPGAESSISWSMPTYKVAGRTIIQLAAWKKHIGIYPGPEALVHFKDRIAAAGLKTSKGTLQVPYSDTHAELVCSIARWCLESR